MLWWKGERPQDYRRIAKFVTPAGYVAGTMAGLKADQAFMDYTFIHFSGFSDAQAGTWSAELCSLLGMDMEKLPRIVEPWQVIGEVTPPGRADFGLAPGTPIAAGAATRRPMRWALALCVPGMLFDVAGTASVLAGCTDQFVADEKNQALLDHALGHSRPVEPSGLHRGRWPGTALVPGSVLQRRERRLANPLKMMCMI